MDLQIRAYLMAVEGIAQEAIARAARLFITGQVKDHNRDFAPSCASFAEQARTQELIINSERRPKIQMKDATEMEHPIEHRLRMLDNMRLLHRFMKGDEGAGRELVDRGYKIETATMSPTSSTGEV